MLYTLQVVRNTKELPSSQKELTERKVSGPSSSSIDRGSEPTNPVGGFTSEWHDFGKESPGKRQIVDLSKLTPNHYTSEWGNDPKDTV